MVTLLFSHQSLVGGSTIGMGIKKAQTQLLPCITLQSYSINNKFTLGMVRKPVAEGESLYPG